MSGDCRDWATRRDALSIAVGGAATVAGHELLVPHTDEKPNATASSDSAPSLTLNKPQFIQSVHEPVVADDTENHIWSDKEDNPNDTTEDGTLTLFNDPEFVKGRMATVGFFVSGSNLKQIDKATITVTQSYKNRREKTTKFDVSGENLWYASNPHTPERSAWKVGLPQSLARKAKPGLTHDKYPVFELTNDLESVTVNVSGPVSASTTVSAPGNLVTTPNLNIGMIEVSRDASGSAPWSKAESIAKACQEWFPTSTVDVYLSSSTVEASKSGDQGAIANDMGTAYKKLHDELPIDGESIRLFRVERQELKYPIVDMTEFDVTVGIVSSDYFANHGQPDTLGQHDPYDFFDVNGHPKRAAFFAKDTGEEVPVHEMTHHFFGAGYADAYAAVKSTSTENPEDPNTWEIDNAHITEDYLAHVFSLEDGTFESWLDTHSIMIKSNLSAHGLDIGAYTRVLEEGFKEAEASVINWPF